MILLILFFNLVYSDPNITFQQTDSLIKQIQFCRLHSQNKLLVLTEVGDVINQENNKILNNINKIVQNQFVESGLFFIQENALFYTIDFGLNIIESKLANIVDIYPNPNDNSILAITKHSNSTLYDLYFTANFGKDWNLIQKWVSQVSWNLPQTKQLVEKDQKQRIIVSSYGQDCTFQSIINKHCKSQIKYSDDNFITTQNTLHYGLQFKTHQNLVFVTVETKELYVSIKKQGPMEFEKIEIAEENISQFSILDSQENIFWLNILHEGDDINKGNLYISSQRGTEYYLNFEDNFRDQEGQVDFTLIQSLDGVMIVNKLIDQKKRTFISYNQGSTWNNLKSPNYDSLGKKITTKQGINLHLFGLTDGYSIHSHEHSQGIIMGVGNIGEFLDFDKINTYISIDAGQHWIEVRKGDYLFELGDHAGIIIMAKNQQLTNEVLYSQDYGSTWESLKISQSLLNITQINIDRYKQTQTFIITANDSGRGYLISIDFSGLKQNICKGYNTPQNQDSDFEIWYPFSSSHCINGQNMYIIRRKHLAKCYNEHLRDKVKHFDICQCQEFDWECDIGFHRDFQNICQPINDKYKILDVKPEPCKIIYIIRSGYRLRPGTKCIGGVYKGPVKRFCQKVNQNQKIKKQKKKALISEQNINNKIQEENKKLQEYFIKNKIKKIKTQQRKSEFDYTILVIYVFPILMTIWILYYFRNDLKFIGDIIRYQINKKKKYPTLNKNSNIQYVQIPTNDTY